MYRIGCAEVWGGSHAIDTDVCTNGLTASLFSTTSDFDDGSGDERSGGDIYYISVCSHDQLTRVVLADVVGHGAAVSHLSRWLYDGMIERLENLDGSGILTGLNELIVNRGLEVMTTAVMMTFYKDASQLYFSSAGHPPILHCRRKKGKWEALGIRQSPEPSNLPLGILRDTFYDQGQTPLASGDRLFLHTDGVTEMMNAEGELFGAARLLEALDGTNDMPLSEVKRTVSAAIYSYSGVAPQDDLTMIVLEIN